MTAAHFHLALNHIPVLGTLFGTVLLAFALWRGQKPTQNLILGFLVVVGAVAIPVYLTGEPAEEIVEGLAGVSHDAIEVHESWGQYALIASIITAVGALLVLTLRLVGRRLAGWMLPGVLVLSLLTTGVMAYTANLGGKINHEELRGATSAVESETSDENDDH